MNDLENRLTAAMSAAADEAQIDPDAWQQNEERLLRQSPQRRLLVSSAVGLAAAAVAAVIAVTFWPNNHRNVTPAGPTPAPSVSQVLPTPSHTEPSTGGTPATSLPPSLTPSSAGPSTAVQDEALTPAVREALIDAYSVGTHTPRAQITGTRPGSAYYALDPTTGMHWAVAEFEFTGPVVAEQDGGSFGIFSQPTGGTWKLVGHGELASVAGGAVADCRSQLPSRVVVAWAWDVMKPTCGS